MNHIPKFLIYKKKQNKMSSRTPKLERRLALKKNIEYDPPTTSSSDTLRTRSLDLPTSTSFRIQGIDDNEVDLICQTIGLSGPDDLSIPASAWEAWDACKARSVSDLLPRFRKHDEDNDNEGQNREHVFDLSTKFKDSVIVSVPDQVVNNNNNKDQCLVVENTISDDIVNERCPFVDVSDQCMVKGGVKSGVKSVRTGLRTVSVSPKVVNNTGSILDVHGNRNATVDSLEHCSTSRGRGRVKDDNTSLLAPRGLLLPTIVDNTSVNLDMNSGDVDNVRYVEAESKDSCSTIGGRSKGVTALFSHSVIDNTRSNWDVSSSDNNGGGSVDKHVVFGSVGGIKGVRPPLLAPPPSISTRVIDNTSSTWDIMRSFAPDSEKTPSLAKERSFYSDDEEEKEVRPRGSAAFLSESCSFTTTSNDDDSSSTTTEPMSNISPNGKFKRVITYWEKGELLGRGSFGTVYEGIADGGYFIAVKEVSLLDQGDMGRQSIYQLEQEIALLSQFEHENIVQYYGTDKDEAHLYIFLELVTKGSLLSLYQKYHLRDSQVSSYTRQILHGLKYLHERNVVHRDIKCANILVGADGSVKLADFGLAKATKLNDVKSCKGTAFWMAPEVVRGRQQGYGLPADIWSLGCTVLEMLTHRIPYSPLECMQALFRIGRGEPPPIPDSLSRDARDFISRCLKVDPNDRPTATQLLEHSFVRRPLSTSSGSSSPYHSIGRGLNLS